MHHGQEPPERRAEFMKKAAQIEKRLRETMAGLGPTGRFPEGKLTPDDEGEFAYRVGHHHGKVVIDFGTPVAWVGFAPEEARALALFLTTHAVAAEKERADDE